MNFDCPGCQAKYQIADEKVASKAVKMKCRKCQTPILISSLGARRALGVSEGKAITIPPGMSVAPIARSLSPPSISRRRSLGLDPHGESVGALETEAPAPPFGLGAPGAGAVPLTTPAGHRRPSAPPSRTASGSGSPLHKASLPPSRPPRATAASEDVLAAPAPAPSVVGRLATPPDRLEDGPISRAPSLGPHLGGLQIQIRERAEGGPPSLRRMASKMPMEAWHVGLEGSVQGPWTRTEIGERCKSGEVTAETLVWKDGMSGWAQVGNVEALRELIAPPLEARPAAPVPLGQAPAGGPSGDDGQHAPAPDLGSTFSAVIGAEVVAKPVRGDSIWARVEASAPKRTHIAFLALAAAVFGGAMTFAVFGGSETKVVEKIVQVHVKDAVNPADNVPPPPTVTDAPDLAASRSTSTTKAATSAGRPTSEQASNSAATSASDAKGGLKGLSGLVGLSAAGPQAGPLAGSGASFAQALDSSQVQSTVSRYQSGVKRGCWQPALDSRDKSAPSSARVSVTITVTSSGAVKNVSTSGDPSGYRGLASCIQSRVATWSFPVSSGSTTVNVPFVFAAQ